MKRRVPRVNSERPLTAEDLARYLFGDQMDPNDTGLIGRLMEDMKNLRVTTQRQVRGVLMLGWAILVVLIAALLSLVGNLLLHLIPQLP